MNDRKLADPISFRPFEDSFFYLQKASDASGRAIRELLRDIVDEAVQARCKPPADPGAEVARWVEPLSEQIRMLMEQNRSASERYEELLKRYEQLAEREGKLKQGLIAQLRLIGGIIGEVLAAAIGARRLAWNYVAYESLKGSKNYTDAQIKERLEAEDRASNAERDETIKEVKRIIGQKYPAE
jgi:hypothetical protein